METKVDKIKTLWLIRGLPGSGKSTLANALGAECFSCDDYWVDHDEYKFDIAKYADAQEFCKTNVSNAMWDGHDNIAVANVFRQVKSMTPYIDLAEQYGYRVFVVCCQNDFGSIHGVPLETLSYMSQNFESFNFTPKCKKLKPEADI